MHIESENYDFLMYTLNGGKPVPSLYIYPVLPYWVIGAFSSGVYLIAIYYLYVMRGRVGTDIGIKLLPVMWVFLCIPRHVHCS